MARRDNQGVQIAMIVFILTTLVFMVTTYFGWSSSTRLQAEKTDLQSKLDTANNGLRTSETLLGSMKRLLGIPDGQSNDGLEAAVQDAVKRFGQGLPEDNLNFQDIAAHQLAQIQDLNRRLAQANDLERQLRLEVEQTKKSQQEIVTASRAAETQAVDDLNQRRAEFDKARAELEAKRAELADQLEKTKSTTTQEVALAQGKVGGMNKEIQQLEIQVNRLKDLLEQVQKESPDQVDGKVAYVQPATKTVWIDIGAADGVRTKITFGVFDAASSNLATSKKKATIEITRVLGDHRSEALITDTDYLSPIVPGDFIWSPLWSPNEYLGIALVGPMDIDQDNRDDRDYIRNLVKLNGGRIDAEDVDGKVQGQLTVETRYVVVGDSEKNQSGGALTSMLDEAKRLGVEIMPVSELLDVLGYSRRARSVSYTGNPLPGDFAPKPLDNQYRSSDQQLRERVPTDRRLRTKAAN